MDGDLKKIRLVGEYMIEVWKAAGMNMDNVEFLWASDEINKRAEEYWSKVMDIAMRFNLKRVLRCCTIMGRAVSFCDGLVGSGCSKLFLGTTGIG
jgi:tyrosyl-tRNA synthetase